LFLRADIILGLSVSKVDVKLPTTIFIYYNSIIITKV